MTSPMTTLTLGHYAPLLHRSSPAPPSTLPQRRNPVFLRRDLRQRADYFANPAPRAGKSSPPDGLGSWPREAATSPKPLSVLAFLTQFRVGEEVTPLTPHRPERAQLRHSVSHRTGLLTNGHSDGRSSVWVGEKPVVLDQMLPSTGSSYFAANGAIATCAINGEPRDAGYSNCPRCR